MSLRNILIALAITGIIAMFFLYKKIHTETPRMEPTVKPSINPYPDAVAASGIVEAEKENIKIGTPVSGIVKKVFVEVWDPVKKGDPLFEIDDRDLIGQMYVQEANVAVADATLKRLQDQFERLQGVKDERAVSKDEVKTRENDVLVAKAQLEQAKAQVEQTKLLLSRLLIQAPQDGVILKNDIRPGEFMQAAANDDLMLLGDVEKMQVRVDVDEQNASRIRPNQPAVAFLKNNTSYKIPLEYVRIEPYVIPKKSLTGSSEERVDTRVLQLIYSFNSKQGIPVYVGQQVDVYIDTSTNESQVSK